MLILGDSLYESISNLLDCFYYLFNEILSCKEYQNELEITQNTISYHLSGKLEKNFLTQRVPLLTFSKLTIWSISLEP